MNMQSEKLSTLMDDYHLTEQDQSTLDDVLNNVDHQYTLRRYQLIGGVMRNEVPDAIQLDFAASVMSKIERESTLHVKQPVEKSHEHNSSWFWSVLFKPVAGLTVAATVAFVAVSNLQLKPAAVDQPDQIASNDSSQAKVEHLVSLPVINSGLSNVSTNGKTAPSLNGMNWKIKRNQPAVQQKLNEYLVNHNEFSNSWQGIIPQVRVVGFDAQK